MGDTWRRQLVHRTSNGTLHVSQIMHTRYNSRTNIRHSRIFPKTFHMPQMYSMDATYHSAQDLIYSIHNPAPKSLLVKLFIGHKGALKTLADIFRKSNPPAVHPRVPVREVGQKKLQEMNQEGTLMKMPPQ